MIKGCVQLVCLVVLTGATSYEVAVNQKPGRWEVTFNGEGGSDLVSVKETGDGCSYTWTNGEGPSAEGWGGLVIDPTASKLIPLWQMKIYDGEKILASIDEVLLRKGSCLEIRNETGALLGKVWKGMKPEGLCVLSGDGKRAYGELNWPTNGLYTVMEDSPIDVRVHKILLAYFLHKSWEKGSALNWQLPVDHDGGYRVVHTHHAPKQKWTTIVGPGANAQHIMRRSTGTEFVYVASNSLEPTAIHDCLLFARPTPTERGSGEVGTYEVYGEQQRYLGFFHHYWAGKGYRIDLFNPSRTFLGSVEWLDTHAPLTFYQVGRGWKGAQLTPCMTFSSTNMQIHPENGIDERLLRMIVGYVLSGSGSQAVASSP